MTTNKQSIPTIKSLVIGIVGFLSIFNYVLFCEDVYLIKEPTPTVVEDKPVFLEEVEKIDMDLGNDQYLFTPKSLAADETDLFVHDTSQARVYRFSSDLKLIGSFGRIGQGPGEFHGKTRVELSIGKDGNVYAHDIYGLKIMGYTKEGKYLKTFQYGRNTHIFKPVCDKQGNLLFVTLKNNMLKVETEQEKVLAQCKADKLHQTFLYEIPKKGFRDMCNLNPFYDYATGKLTKDSKLLIFFRNSSVLSIFKDKEYIKTVKLWPEEALKEYKPLYLARDKNKIKIPRLKYGGSFRAMFGRIFVDQDNQNIFYLHFTSRYRKKEIGVILYAFDIDGNLLKVIHILTSPDDGDSYGKFVSVHAKVNNTFYAIRGNEEVVLYKEKKR